MIFQCVSDGLVIDNGERKFQAIFEHAAIGIALVARDGKFSEVNASLQRMLGYSMDELRGMSFVDVTHPDDRIKDWKLFQELLQGRRVDYQIEKRYFRRNGSMVWARVTVSVVEGVDRDGGVQVVGMVEDISQRKWAEEQLEGLADTDVLTGLLNQRGFRDVAEAMWRLARRRREPLAVLLVDIDDLGGINRAFGVRTGDRVLADLGELLRDTCRDSDLVARMDADLFVVLAMGADREAAATLLRRVEQRLAEYNRSRADRRYVVALSTGSACFDPAAPRSLDDLLGDAHRELLHDQYTHVGHPYVID